MPRPCHRWSNVMTRNRFDSSPKDATQLRYAVHPSACSSTIVGASGVGPGTSTTYVRPRPGRSTMRPSGMLSISGGAGSTCFALLSSAEAPAPAPRRTKGAALENVIGSSFGLPELAQRRADLSYERSQVGDEVGAAEQRDVEPVDIGPGGHVEAYTLQDRPHTEEVGERRAGDGHLVGRAAHVRDDHVERWAVPRRRTSFGEGLHHCAQRSGRAG